LAAFFGYPNIRHILFCVPLEIIGQKVYNCIKINFFE